MHRLYVLKKAGVYLFCLFAISQFCRCDLFFTDNNNTNTNDNGGNPNDNEPDDNNNNNGNDNGSGNDNDPDPPPIDLGPDIITGDVNLCQQLGRVGDIGAGTIGMSCDTLACNAGDEGLDWFALPDTRHPVIFVNMFRLQTVDGSRRLQQIGYSWIKHVAQTESDGRDGCGMTCEPSGTITRMGPGCRDAYLAEEFLTCDLGPRSSIHPYTGEFAGGASLGQSADCATNYPSRNHLGHDHTSISHVVQIEEADLESGRFFAEGGYIAEHEFREGNGNQNNNVSFREVTVSSPDGDGVYTFTQINSSATEAPAIEAWEGADFSTIEPDPGVDGYAVLGFEVTDLGGGVWHYEYAIQNVNLDRAIGSFSIPIPDGVAISDVEFFSPKPHPDEAHADDYSETPWSFSESGERVRWATQTFSANDLANAIRWGTLYNFRFNADTPPQDVEATIGFFKTGDTQTLTSVGPSPPS